MVGIAAFDLGVNFSRGFRRRWISQDIVAEPQRHGLPGGDVERPEDGIRRISQPRGEVGELEPDTAERIGPAGTIIGIVDRERYTAVVCGRMFAFELLRRRLRPLFPANEIRFLPIGALRAMSANIAFAGLLPHDDPRRGDPFFVGVGDRRLDMGRTDITNRSEFNPDAGPNEAVGINDPNLKWNRKSSPHHVPLSCSGLSPRESL
ncbi:MAG: hypothetical protein COX66_07290 [Elusimicrobia bacterium CG_4_10_14_0_2_um_filter_63_34]|nr:MAG: hypothetical protein COX66_07290 [Elusimicrobia bacterium CG_4_10_14_0_2_um_filter_63_34]